MTTDDAEFGRSIHERLIQGDAVAPKELADHWFEALAHDLGAHFPAVARRDESLIYEAVTQALLSYAERPGIYQPARSELRTFLFHAARCDLLNVLERERRRAAHEQPLDDVGDRAFHRNDHLRGGDDGRSVESMAIDRITAAEYRQTLETLFPDERDRQLLDLMLAGERRTEQYAAVLGIDHLDRASQQREVKRHKDRIDKRLRRWRESHHDQSAG